MFKIYSSSAGSGKTFTLTKEYLKLALHSEDESYFKHILAVTFTNAAANEMKERIISALRIFSSNANAGHPMFGMIIHELIPDTATDAELYNVAADLIEARSRKVLDKILHQYADFSVMTIDKFTNRLVSSFSDELQLPFGFETVLERDLLDAAIDRVLSRVGLDGEEALTDIIEKYYLDKAREGKSWKSLPAELRKTSSELLNESGRSFLHQMKDFAMSDWAGIQNQLLQFIKGKEEIIASTADAAVQLMRANDLTESDFYQGRNGIFKYFDNRRTGVKLFDEPNSHLWKTILEGKWYGGKTSAATISAIDSISADLEHYFYLIEETRAASSGQVILYKNIDKHLHKLSLLNEIGREFEILLRQNNQAHISEFNRKITEIVTSEPVPFIFERLGERYNHVLIDEFQDTSKLQFANLLPLIDNALAKGYFNLIVGDAKQSVYRFRGGDMDLLVHLYHNQPEKLSRHLGDDSFTAERIQSLLFSRQTEHLKINRRSYREITEFNNDFFEKITSALSEEYPGISSVFDNHFKQETPEGAKTGGHVEIQFIAAETNEDAQAEEDHPLDDNDPMADRVVALVSELRSKGYDWRDIAILCRKNSEAAHLANVLKSRKWPLISEDALLLDYAGSVRFAIAFMKVFNQPENTTDRLESALIFQSLVLRKSPDASALAAIGKMCNDTGLESYIIYFNNCGLQLNIGDFKSMGLYEFSENVFGKFGLFGQGEDEYIFRFLDVALSYGNKKNNRMDAFLAYWELRKGSLSISVSPNTNAIRITSIHKSKGLEFPVVILPYTHWKFAPRPDLPVWMSLPDLKELSFAGTDGLKTLTAAQLNMVSDLEKTGLSANYHEEKERVLTENLNLLYVALTRPVQRLYILAKSENNWNRSGKSVNYWLRDYVHTPDSVDMEDNSSYVISRGNDTPAHAERKNSTMPHRIEKLRGINKISALRLRRLADRIFDIESFEKKMDPIQKTRYALSFLHTAEDIPGILRLLTNEGIANGQDLIYLDESLRNITTHPDLSVYFDSGSTILLNRELLLPGGEMVTPHRVVINKDGSCRVLYFTRESDRKESEKDLKRALTALSTMKYTGVTGMIVSMEDWTATPVGLERETRTRKE